MPKTAAMRVDEFVSLQKRLQFAADVASKPDAPPGSLYLYTLACAYLASEEGSVPVLSVYTEEQLLEFLMQARADDEGADSQAILEALTEAGQV